MELRASRSRSRTPLPQQTKIVREAVSERMNHSQESVVHHSYSTRQAYKLNTSSLSDDVFSTPRTLKSEKIVKKTRQKTSDYSSEDGENEISSSKLDDMSTVVSNGNIKRPSDVYKEAGEYWNKYPKTDYTYSVNSKDRIEISPGLVAMPNMSRRSLRRSAEPTSHHTKQQQYHSDSIDHATSYEDNYYNNNSNNRLKPKSLVYDDTVAYYQEKHVLQNHSNHTSVSITRKMYTSITSTVSSIYTSVLMVLLIISQTCSSSVLWVGSGYYKAVSRLLLLDTWLVHGTTRNRKWTTLISLMALLLLLLTGWWLWSGLSHALQGVFIPTATETTLPTPSPNIMDTIQLEEQLAKIIIPTSQGNTKEKLNANTIIEMLLQNPEFENIIARHISSKTAMYDRQQDSLRNEVTKVNKKVDDLTINVNKKVDDLTMNLKLENIRNAAKFTTELNKCCRKQLIYIESYVKKLLADLIGASNGNIQPDDISKWLQTVFVAKENLETRLSEVTQHLNADLQKLVEASAAKIMTEVSNKINVKLLERVETSRSNSFGFGSALSDTEVHRIVQEALAVYDADKTGLVDYALESAGGQILSTRCTESYHARTARYTIFNIPLWYPSNTPRIVITPGVVPGECWAFQNFPGFLVVQLTATVELSAFSLEHIPKSLDPGGRRDSAPKDFTVWGLTTENDRDPWQLGKYRYILDGPSLQYFEVETQGPAFDMVELRIESNHGNLNYTCLYRFRVHGMLSHIST